MGGGTRTIVLMGKTGNGKSSTGNSILGKPAQFKARMSSGGVTRAAECHSATLANGEVVNVIDTPGLFDFSVGTELTRKGILNCLELAEDNGIHAVLLVFSVRVRFSEEEAAALHILQTYFGPKLTPYIIVVFTGGDEVEDDGSLEDYLVNGPDSLKKIVQVCKNRVALFDNKTNDEKKKELQRQKLFTLLDDVLKDNGGQTYTKVQFAEFREAAVFQLQEEEANASKEKKEQEVNLTKEEFLKTFGQQLEGMSSMVETKLKVTTQMLQQQLDEEKDARLKAEKAAENVVNTSEEGTNDLNLMKEHLLKSYGQRLEGMSQMVETKLKETTQMLDEEKAARLKAEEAAKNVAEKSLEEARKLKQKLEDAKRRPKEDAKRRPKDPIQIVREGLAVPHRAVHKFVANVADHAATSHRLAHQFVADHAAVPHKVVHKFVANVADHATTTHRVAHKFVADHAANSHRKVHHVATSALKFFGL